MFSSIGPPTVSIHRSWKSLSELRIRFRARRDRARETGRDVGMGDEVQVQGGREKAIHPGPVVETLAEQISPIPAQQDVADVKDDDQGGPPYGGGPMDRRAGGILTMSSGLPPLGYLENFLYFNLCGMTLSIPSRRFLSSS